MISILKNSCPYCFRKLNEKATVFVEYAPLEQAWVPIEGDNYYYIYCLFAPLAAGKRSV